MTNKILLGVNIDHVATLRQARGTDYPCPIQAALAAERAGADGITAHLREDRRHIHDRDIELLQLECRTRLNLEMAATDEMLVIAKRVQPPHCCIVPEKREELTTEGGLDVLAQQDYLKDYCAQLTAIGIEVSLFIDPDFTQIDAAKAIGVPAIEIHTGEYAETPSRDNLARVERAVAHGCELGLCVNAGHGLHYDNVAAISQIAGINELNIGHSIVAHGLMVGFPIAVSEMKKIMLEARQ